jgi:hypothetical protein
LPQPASANGSASPSIIALSIAGADTVLRLLATEDGLIQPGRLANPIT